MASSSQVSLQNAGSVSQVGLGGVAETVAVVARRATKLWNFMLKVLNYPIDSSLNIKGAKKKVVK